jgi:hypothetical protein
MSKQYWYALPNRSLSNLEDGGIRFSEAPIPIYQTIWHHIPEENNVQHGYRVRSS